MDTGGYPRLPCFWLPPIRMSLPVFWIALEGLQSLRRVAKYLPLTYGKGMAYCVEGVYVDREQGGGEP